MDKTGLVRILTIRDGTPYKRYEQLIRYDAPNRTLVYQLIDKQRSRVAVKNYTATIRVRKITIHGPCKTPPRAPLTRCGNGWPVEIGEGGLGLLVSNGLLKEHETRDRKAVGAACLAALEQWSMGRGARTVGGEQA